jgi:hypothetical protein
MFRRVESGVGRALLCVGGFLLATLIVGVVIGIANSNLFWGEDNQYGRVDFPGTKVVHLPSGTTQVSIAAALPGRGNETPDMPLPARMGLAVTPVGGGGQPKVSLHVGGSVNADGNGVDTQRPVWHVSVPSAGDYRVTGSGDFAGFGVDAQLWLGYEPGFVHGPMIWLVAALIVLGVIAIVLVLGRLRSGRGSAEPATA